MVGVIIAVVTGLVALIPAFATSERRRLLRYLQDESKLVDETEDEALKGAHRKAALATSRHYRSLANVGKVDRLRGQWRLLFGPVYVSMVASALFFFFSEDLTNNDQTAQYIRFGATVLLVLVGGALVVQLGRVSSAVRQEQRDSESVRRAERAEALLDETETRLDEAASHIPVSAGGLKLSLNEEELERAREAMRETTRRLGEARAQRREQRRAVERYNRTVREHREANPRNQGEGEQPPESES